MKKLILLIILAGASFASYSQSCAQSCDRKSCGPEGTKKAEAAVITTMRTNLMGVIDKMSKSTLTFDDRVKGMKIEKGTTDDESLFFISQAAASIRYELLTRVDPARVVASLKEYRPAASSNKQQMVASLQQEIKLLTAQAELL